MFAIERMFFVVLLLVVSGCGGLRPAPRPPDLSPTPYLLKVGDTLDIRFYKTPELNIDVPVRSDGKISLELLGDVQAAGLSPDQLSQILTTRYEKELMKPRVTVIVRAFGGNVYVSGEVKAPNIIAYANGMTALQAIDNAGGFLDTAKRTNVILIRNMNGHWQGHKLELNSAIHGKDFSDDVPLQPTDIVHVPKSIIANVNLFVEQYIRNNLPITPALGAAAF